MAREIGNDLVIRALSVDKVPQPPVIELQSAMADSLASSPVPPPVAVTLAPPETGITGEPVAPGAAAAASAALGVPFARKRAQTLSQRMGGGAAAGKWG